MNVTTFFENYMLVILPEVFLLISASTLLLIGVGLTTDRGEGYPNMVKPTLWLSVYVILLTGLLIQNNPVPSAVLFNGAVVHDEFTNVAKTILLLSTAACLSIAVQYVKKEGLHAYEFGVLVLFSLAGMMALVSSFDLISFYLAIELQSLCFYTLAAFKRHSAFSTESGLKYFILGAFSSGLLLFGCSLVYGFTGTTNFEELAKLVSGMDQTPELVSSGLTIGILFIATALLFKVSAAPFHQWSIDVYEGAPTIVSAFFAVVPKIAILGLFLRLFYFSFYDLIDSWQQIMVIASLASMVLASLVALQQKKLKRFLAYSSIGHVGYMLVGFSTGTIEGVQSLLLYAILYVVLVLSAWTFVLSTEKQKGGRAVFFTDLSAMSRINPLLALTFTAIMFSSAGVPPLSGFLAKMYVFFAAMEGSMYLLAVVGVLTSVIGAFYYIRFIKIMYFEEVKQWTFFAPIGREQSLVLGTTTLFITGFFLYPTPLLLLTHKLALTLCL